MNHNKHSTPILSAVRAMHADDDTSRKAAERLGYDPYHGRLRRPIPVPGEFPQTAKHEADQILACYDSALTLENDK